MNSGCDPMKQPVSKAVILVGGFGTRLRPLTYTVPKPLVSFCNKPILKYQIEKLVEVGVKEVILALNYHSEKIKAEVEKYKDEFGIEIIYSKEDEPLGTAGPLSLVKDKLKNTSFFVMNADICCNANLAQMKEEYMNSDCAGSILTYAVEDPLKYGLLKLEGKRITSFLEKPKSVEGKGPWLINAGMYILSGEVLDMVEPREMSIETEIFPKLAEKGRLDSFVFEGYWMDIGQPMDYIKGQSLEIANMSTVVEGVDKENNVVVGKNVKIGNNVHLKNCSIFDHAVIEDGVTVENSIIGWGSHVQGGSKIVNFSVLGENTIVNKNSYVEKTLTMPNTKIGESE